MGGSSITAVALVLLHGPGGREILISPGAVTSMQAAIEGKPNQNLAEAVRCVINTSDGKFVSVIETCGKIRELLEGRK